MAMSVKDLNLEFNNEINVEIQPQASFRGHTNSVEVVAINPADSNMAITASHDHQIGVWDLNKKQAVKIMNAHSKGVWCIQFSDDGKYYATCGPDTIIKIWSTKNNKCEKELKAHTDSVYWCAFDRTGNKLVSCGKNYELIQWDLKKGKCIITTRPESKITNCVKVSLDNLTVFTAEKNGWLEAWNNDRLRHLTKTKVPGNIRDIHHIDLNYTNPKRPRIYTACSDGIFRTYEYVDMQFNCIFQYKGHVDMVKTIKYVPEKNVLITGCRDAGIKIWDAYDYNFIAHLTKHRDQVVSFDYHPSNPDRLISGSWDQTINIYDLSRLAEMKEKVTSKLQEMNQTQQSVLRESQNLSDSWDNSKSLLKQIQLARTQM